VGYAERQSGINLHFFAVSIRREMAGVGNGKSARGRQFRTEAGCEAAETHVAQDVVQMIEKCGRGIGLVPLRCAHQHGCGHRRRGALAADIADKDALAVAGDPSDAALLVEVAAEESVDAGPLLLAAANLGHRATLEALPSFIDRVPGDVLGEARRRIAGEDPPAETSLPPGRLFRGQAWSVARHLERLSDPREAVSAQRLLALELRVRTGVVPPNIVPRLASTKERLGTIASWTSHYAKSNGRLDAATWYYQGKPLPSASGSRA